MKTTSGLSMSDKKRFILTTAEAIGEEPDSPSTTIPTRWWVDTERFILTRAGRQKVFVQVYADKDPNDFVKCEGMRILFTDKVEYYFVCGRCYTIYAAMQWTGTTRGPVRFRERATNQLHLHEKNKGWCEFCDPVFGNGGWSLHEI